MSTRLWFIVVDVQRFLSRDKVFLTFWLTDVSLPKDARHKPLVHKRHDPLFQANPTNEAVLSLSGFSHTPEWGVGQITARKNMRATGKERHRISVFGISPAVPSPKRRAIFISDGPLFHSVEANGQKGGIPENPSEERALAFEQPPTHMNWH